MAATNKTELTHVDSDAPLRVVIATANAELGATIVDAIRSAGGEPIGPICVDDDVIAACKRHTPDLAIIDLALGGESDRRLADRVARSTDTPLVALSNACDPSTLRWCGRLGAVGYLINTDIETQIGPTLVLARTLARVTDDQQDEVDQLRQALEDRKSIEQAKWILMQAGQLAPAEADARLASLADKNKRSVAAEARAVLDASALLQAG
ncbi:MAG: ANTAR domain-containing protein [Planctomycetota bacterium]